MTDTQILTVKSLYATSGLFRAAVAKWVADMRCPVELGDFLEENGLLSAADCARWCMARPALPRWDIPGVRCSTFPSWWASCNWSWTICRDQKVDLYCHRLPIEHVDRGDGEFGLEFDHRCPEDAILWLLENWKP